MGLINRPVCEQSLLPGPPASVEGAPPADADPAAAADRRFAYFVHKARAGRSILSLLLFVSSSCCWC